MEQASMLKASRLQGAMRYFTRKSLVACLEITAVVLAMSLVSIAINIFAHVGGNVNSLSSLFSANGLVAIVLCAYAAFSESRYLALTPMPRFSIYLGIICKMAVFAVASSLCAALHSIIEAALSQAVTNAGLAQITLEVFEFDIYGVLTDAGDMRVAKTVGEVASMALGAVPDAAISLLTMSGGWYLYMCLLRRWKAATLAVTIGGPILLFTMILVPAMTGWLDTLVAMSEAEMMQTMPALYKMIQSLIDILRWIRDEWPFIRAISGLVCWLLAYPVMRGTPQPN